MSVSLVKHNAHSGFDREARRRRLAHLRVRANSDRAVALRIIRRNDLNALAHWLDRYPTVQHMQDRADMGEAPTVSVVKAYAPARQLRLAGCNIGSCPLTRPIRPTQRG